ncbi:MAG: hypothetical protein GY862_14065, partial [Gammaproteobacteria bacterium]|nr:hypothetical protein [Gammaproteobacteria bacterium]
MAMELPLHAGCRTPLALLDCDPLCTGHSAPLGMLIQAGHSAPMAMELPLHAGCRTPLALLDCDPLHAGCRAPLGMLILGGHSAPLATQLPLFAGHRAPLSFSVPIHTGHKAPVALLAYHPLLTGCRSPVTMLESPVIPYVVDYYAIHQRRRVDISDATLRQGVDDYCWSGTVTLMHLADYMNISIDDPISLFIQGDEYVLKVEEKNHSRQGSAMPNVSLRVISPTSDLATSKKITATWPATWAHAAAESIAGQAIDWRIVDWPIPAGILTYTDSVPMDILREIAGAPKGIIQTARDGTLRAQYRIPVPVRYWNTAAPDEIYVDRKDNLSYSEGFRAIDRWNAVVIRNEELLEDEPEYHIEYTQTGPFEGVLHVYAEPWQDPKSIIAEHTGRPSVYIGSGALKLLTEQEIVEFKKGSATVQYPVYNILSLVWRHTNLAPYVWALDSKDFTAIGGNGYSLAEITYSRRVVEFRVTFTISEDIQFLVRKK